MHQSQQGLRQSRRWATPDLSPLWECGLHWQHSRTSGIAIGDLGTFKGCCRNLEVDFYHTENFPYLHHWIYPSSVPHVYSIPGVYSVFRQIKVRMKRRFGGKWARYSGSCSNSQLSNSPEAPTPLSWTPQFLSIFRNQVIQCWPQPAGYFLLSYKNQMVRSQELAGVVQR